MSDDLKVAEECGIKQRHNDPSELWCYRHELEAYTSRILASQQAAHEAEIAKLKESWDDLRGFLERTQKELSAANAACAMLEPLRAQVAMLYTKLAAYIAAIPAQLRNEDDVKAIRFTQATAEQFIAECEQRGAVKALEDAKADNGRGFSLWFSREEWGGIIDGLVLEIERSGGRKKTNSESTSDVRMTMCERIIAAISNACELSATSKKAG